MFKTVGWDLEQVFQFEDGFRSEALVKEHGKALISKLDHSSMESTKPCSKLSTEELNRLVLVHADVEQRMFQSAHYQLVDVLKRI